jgi:hypothetical protein
LGEDGLKLMTPVQQHTWNWKLAWGFHWSQNGCLKEEAQSYKMQQPSHNQRHHTYSIDSNEDT